MTAIMVLFALLISSAAHAWSTLFSDGKGLPVSEINVYVINQDCSNARITASELASYVVEASDQFWNKNSPSKLKLNFRGFKQTSLKGVIDIGGSAKLASANSILIGCNSDMPDFKGGRVLGVGGMGRLGKIVQGAIIMNHNSQRFTQLRLHLI